MKSSHKTKEELDEASTVGSGTGSSVGDIKGFQGRFGGRRVKKRMVANKKKNINPDSPYSDDLFENIVAQAMMENDFDEIVRPVGNSWVFYDDDTGAQKGSFKDREIAWDTQRKDRNRKRAQKDVGKSERERQRKSLEPTKAKKASAEKGKASAKRSKKAKLAHQKARERKTVSLLRKLIARNAKALRENIKSLKEGTMISYMFEQTPLSQEAAIWEDFVSKLSKDTIMADQKLKEIINRSMKTEAQTLGKAVDEVSKALGGSNFQVESQKLSRSKETGDVFAEFVVKLPESKQTYKFAMNLENNKPLVVIPEDTRMAMNETVTSESKLLRAELMHVQETILNVMEDVMKVSEERDIYLSEVQSGVSKIVENMSMLEVAMLKHMLKHRRIK